MSPQGPVDGDLITHILAICAEAAPDKHPIYAAANCIVAACVLMSTEPDLERVRRAIHQVADAAIDSDFIAVVGKVLTAPDPDPNKTH